MGFPVPLPVCCRVLGKRNWEVIEMAVVRSRLSGRDIWVCRGAVIVFVARAQRAARRYPSVDLTTSPAAIMAARRS